MRRPARARERGRPPPRPRPRPRRTARRAAAGTRRCRGPPRARVRTRPRRPPAAASPRSGRGACGGASGELGCARCTGSPGGSAAPTRGAMLDGGWPARAGETGPFRLLRWPFGGAPRPALDLRLSASGHGHRTASGGRHGPWHEPQPPGVAGAGRAQRRPRPDRRPVRRRGRRGAGGPPLRAAPERDPEARRSPPWSKRVSPAERERRAASMPSTSCRAPGCSTPTATWTCRRRSSWSATRRGRAARLRELTDREPENIFLWFVRLRNAERAGHAGRRAPGLRPGPRARPPACPRRASPSRWPPPRPPPRRPTPRTPSTTRRCAIR